MRRKMIAVVGYAHAEPNELCWQEAFALGKLLVDEGYRVVTGGLGGVMDAAMSGARTAQRYTEGDTLAILPSFDPHSAAGSADIVIATGLDVYRNGLIANADAVIAIGGGAGTLSELAYAWHLCRLVAAYSNVSGWGSALAGKKLDARKRCDREDDCIYPVTSAREVISLLKERLDDYARRPQRL